MSQALRVIFIRRKRLQIYATGMTISAERTEQHVVIGFGEMAAVD